jgi:hypothetical protein
MLCVGRLLDRRILVAGGCVLRGTEDQVHCVGSRTFSIFYMVYCLLHYLHYNSNTTSLVHLFGIVVIFVIEISFTLRLTLQMILS